MAVAGIYLVASGLAQAIGFGLIVAMSGITTNETIRAALLGNSAGSSAAGLARAGLGVLLAGYSARIARAFSTGTPSDAA